MGEFEIHQPEKSSNRTIRMPDELIERMGKIAASKGISFNQLVFNHRPVRNWSLYIGLQFFYLGFLS